MKNSFLSLVSILVCFLQWNCFAVITEWTGTALMPSLIRFTCEQTGEKNEEPVVANVNRFKAAEKAYWVRPIGASRHDRKGRYGVDWAADVEHQVWLPANPAMQDGETRVFMMPDGRKVSFTYHADAPSPLFKLNQLGYAPKAEAKYAYIGEWLGLAGDAVKYGALKEEMLSSFELIDEKTGKSVFKGVPKKRMADGVTPEGTPWTGETTWELDFSEVSAGGTYHLEIPGIGRSDSFVIDKQSLLEAFEVHMAGMKRQHCGEQCHQLVWRGEFPSNDCHYPENAQRKYGFFDLNGKTANVDHFRLILDNQQKWKSQGPAVRVPGGWHDAADYDRRPYHLQAVGEFAALAMLKPECKAAAEEAYWGLAHLLAAQQEDGGVGTWIETIRHPSVGEGPTSEPKEFDYFIAKPTRDSTLEYCAYAAMTAYALPKDDPRRAVLTESADRAWKYAIDPNNGKSWVVDYAGSKIVYRQDPDLPAELLLKAGLNLSFLTKNDDYLKPILEDIERVTAVVNRWNWRWSPFLLIEMDIHERMLEPAIRRIYVKWREMICREADTMLAQQENSWPYRTPWYDAGNGHAKDLGWGYGLPLSRARWFVVAHSITWKKKYLTGAFLANDFHNGANPDGETFTSGLGIRPTRRYLDLEGKYPAGVTPYRLTYNLEWKWLKLCFPDDIWQKWPIWRRYGNFEIMSVKNSEFTVWETIAPAAVVTGYLAF